MDTPASAPLAAPKKTKLIILAALVALVAFVLLIWWIIRLIIGVSVPDGFLMIEYGGNKRVLVRIEQILAMRYTEDENELMLASEGTGTLKLVTHLKAKKLASEINKAINSGGGTVSVTEVK